MIKYTFVSLGIFESFGIRIGGSGLGNILFPWARAIVYAKNNNLQRIQTSWKTLKFGTIFRRERDKRMYFNLFTGRDGVAGIRKFWLLHFSNKVKMFSGMENLFDSFIQDHDYVKSELLKIINPYYIKKVESLDGNSVAIHIRMGDFQIPNDETVLRDGHWNYRLPLEWYKCIIKKIHKHANIPIYVFSDGSDQELEEILQLENCSRVYFGSAVADMLALSRFKLLISSASTFSMWASFLGQHSTIWFPGQMRQKLINDRYIFEGEVDYDDELPESIIRVLQHD
tara:strand:- start:13669 stop:14520 length:852 start_codon:yes stop_codon:yes gene_type:complete